MCGGAFSRPFANLQPRIYHHGLPTAGLTLILEKKLAKKTSVGKKHMA
jgi:hypothetical protein